MANFERSRLLVREVDRFLQHRSTGYGRPFLWLQGKVYTRREALEVDPHLLSDIAHSVAHRNRKGLFHQERDEGSDRVMSIQAKLVQMARRMPKERKKAEERLLTQNLINSGICGVQTASRFLKEPKNAKGKTSAAGQGSGKKKGKERKKPKA